MVTAAVVSSESGRLTSVLSALGICSSSWYRRPIPQEERKRPGPTKQPIPYQVVEAVVTMARLNPWYGYKRIAVMCRRSGQDVTNRQAYRVMKGYGLLHKPLPRKSELYQAAKLFELLPSRPNELWQAIPDRGDIPVFGVATSPDSRELWQWVENTEIPIEVYLDTTFAIEDLMEFQQTPLKVLVDSEGTVIWADPPREPGPARESFWKELADAME